MSLFTITDFPHSAAEFSHKEVVFGVNTQKSRTVLITVINETEELSILLQDVNTVVIRVGS